MESGRRTAWGLALLLLIGIVGRESLAQDSQSRLLVELTNRSRAEAGLPPLKWDAALGAAAYDHALRMAHEGPISHRYGGEPDLATRASSAGARFSLIEENIAVGNSPAQIQEGWMHSQGHHDNLLNTQIDRIGVALVQAHGVLYAVADYERSVPQLSQAEVESQVGAQLQRSGLKLIADVGPARRYCALDESVSGKAAGVDARFMVRWQSAQIGNLPVELQKKVASGIYRQAAVGACAAQGSDDGGPPTFSGYRVAVLLY